MVIHVKRFLKLSHNFLLIVVVKTVLSNYDSSFLKDENWWHICSGSHFNRNASNVPVLSMTFVIDRSPFKVKKIHFFVLIC